MKYYQEKKYHFRPLCCNENGLLLDVLQEDPYTMILIDGMPIVSSLSTVYGLSGIPNSLVERIEVVKGPASSLYGTEAMGGIINVITKSPKSAPKLSLDAFTTSWLETNLCECHCDFRRP